MISTILFTLLRTTLVLTLCAGLCFLALRKTEFRLPTLSRLLWLAVLLTGWFWVQPVIRVPVQVEVVVSTQERGGGSPPVEIPSDSAPNREAPAPRSFEEIPSFEDAYAAHTFVPVAQERGGGSPPVEIPSDSALNRGAPAPRSCAVWILVLWLTGMAITLLLAATAYLRILWSLRDTEFADESTAEPWCNLLAERGIKPQKIPMLLSKNVGPALVRLPFGYRLVIPDALWSELSELGRLGILKHELAHFRRRDVWKSFCVRMLALPHWFNPMAHFAANRFDELAEQLCDREAFLGKQEGLSEFAQVLLLLHENTPTHFVARQSIFGRNLKRRVASLLETPLLYERTTVMKKLLLIMGTAAILCAALFRVEFVETIARAEDGRQQTADGSREPATVSPQPENNGAGTQSPALEESLPDTAELRLLVMDEENKPVPNTRVHLSNDDGTEFTWNTDEEGRMTGTIPFVLAIPATQLYFHNKERGLVAWETFWKIPEDWQPGTPIDLTFTVYKSRRITGTVVDGDGKPVADAIVGYSVAPPNDHTTTDKDGKFELDTLPFQPIMFYAFHPTIGLALAYPDFPSEDLWKIYGDIPDDWGKTERNNGPFTLTLEHGEPVSVRVVDTEGNPIEGVFVAPTYFTAGKKPAWNNVDAKSVTQMVTDRDGMALFQWLPTKIDTTITFNAWGTDPRWDKESPVRFYGESSAVWRAEKKNNALVIQLPKKIMLEGSVRYEDGSVPKRGMQINLQGKTYLSVGIETDNKGKFTFFTNANEIVSLCPLNIDSQKNKPGVAPTKLRVDVGDGRKPVPRFDFILKPGIKVTGKLPKPDMFLKVFEMSSSNDTIDNQNERYINNDPAKGEYEALLPPGKYRFKFDNKESDFVLKINENDGNVRLDFDAEGKGTVTRESVPVPMPHYGIATKTEVVMETRSYNVTDLAPISETIEPNGKSNDSENGSPKKYLLDMIKIITTVIEPDSWKEGDAAMTIHSATQRLVVRQTEDVHVQIEDLLKQIRKLKDTTFTGSVKVNNKAKTPIADATVLVQYWDGPDFTNGIGAAPPEKCLGETLLKTDGNGKYAFALPQNLIGLSSLGKSNLHIKVMIEHPEYISRGFYDPSLAEAAALHRAGEFGNFNLEPATLVKGTVLTPEGKPLAGALISAFSWQFSDKSGGNACYAATDEKGKFSVKAYAAHPESGLLLWVIAKDCAPVLKQFETLPSEAGTIKLETGIPVKGKMLDREGKPLANVWIDVTEKESPAPHPQHKIWRSALTNENGEFETEPLAPGEYVIDPSYSPMDPLVYYERRNFSVMSGEGINTLEDRKRDAASSVVASFKNLPDVYPRRNISIKPAGNAPLEIRPAESAAIRFHVTDSGGKPYTEPLLLVVTGKLNGAVWQTVDESFKTDSQGNGTLQVPVGLEYALFEIGREKTYRSRAIQYRLGSDAAWKTDWCIEFAKIEKEFDSFEIKILKPTVLRVTAIDEEGKSPSSYIPPTQIKYANKELYQDDDHVGFGFHQGFGNMWEAEQKEESGHLVWHKLYPVLPGETFTVTAEADGCEPVTQTLTLTEGETKAIKMVLKKKDTNVKSPREPATVSPSQITGRFVSESGEPIPDVSISVHTERKAPPPLIGRMIDHKDLSGDSNGSFSISVREDEKVDILIRHKDFALKRFTAKKLEDVRTAISLGDVVMKKGFRSTIQVLDKNGEPVSDVWVQLHLAVSQEELDTKTNRMGSTDNEYVLTNAAGQAVFEHVETGDYIVNVVEKPLYGFAQGKRIETPDSKLPVKSTKGVYEEAVIRLSPDSMAAVIQAKPSVNVVVQFSDKQTTPEREENMLIIGAPKEIKLVNAGLTTHSRYKGKHLGGGRFSFEVPAKMRDMELALRRVIGTLKMDKETVYRCFAEGKEIALQGYYWDFSLSFPLPAFEKDAEITLVCYRSPKMMLDVRDETGKPVTEYFAGAQYAKDQKSFSFERTVDTVVVLGGPPNLHRMLFQWDQSGLDIPSGLPMNIQFAWQDFGKSTVRVNNDVFLPNEELCLYVVSKDYEIAEQVIPKMAEGETKTIKVVLKKREPPTMSAQPVNNKAGTQSPALDKTKTIPLTTTNPFEPATYPSSFAKGVTEVEKAVKENNGLALIARVRDADGNPVKTGDFQTTSYYDGFMSGVSCPAADGWFRTSNILATALGRKMLSQNELRNENRPLLLTVHTATNEPAIIELPIEPGNVFYADIVLKKTPEDQLVSIIGTMLDDEEQPIADRPVYLRVPGGVGSTQGLRRTTTNMGGRFVFEKVTPQPYAISLVWSGYSSQGNTIISPDKQKEEHVFHYYKQRDIEIEYVFQPDGSRDFTKGNLQSQTAVWKAEDYRKGFRFATGDWSSTSAGNTPERMRDISYRDAAGKLQFMQAIFTKELNGFYDAGAVPFDSVTEADGNDERYPNPPATPLPVHVGHVYVVKTTEGKYAKFIVRRVVK